MKLLTVIPGFGGPDISLKRDCICITIQQIRDTYTGDIDVRIFCYGEETCGLEWEGVHVEEIVQKGCVGHFLYTYVTPTTVQPYDYVCIVLDDIEFQPDVHIDKCIALYNQHNYDILSPSLTPSSKHSHTCMFSNGSQTIRTVAGMELFCYLLHKESYIRYVSVLDERSAWLWGIDLALDKLGFVCGILDCMTIQHWIKGESYRADLPNPIQERDWNCTRFGLQEPDALRKLGMTKAIVYLEA